MITTERRSRMRAVVCTKPVAPNRLQVTEVDRPALGAGGVLVRIQASSANPVDVFPTTTAGHLMGGRKPVVLGTDFAGVVEAVGERVTRFRIGDEVFGGSRGAFAELLVVPDTAAIVHKPQAVPFEHAGVTAVAGTTALQALRKHGHVEAGMNVLVNGASGGVGTFAVQIAKALDARVTAVCSGRNVEMVRALGADVVVDYTQRDVTRGEDRFDLVVDIAASHSLREFRRVMRPGARFVGTGAAAVQHGRGGAFRLLGHFVKGRLSSLGRRDGVVLLFLAKLNQADLDFLGELMASGRVTPVIDRTYELEQAGAALAYLNEGHARAKVAIAI